MNTNNAILMVLIIGLTIVSLIAFTSSNTENLATPTVSIIASPSASLKNKNPIDIDSRNENINQYGVAYIEEFEGKVKLSLSLNDINSNQNYIQSAHILSGTCDKPKNSIHTLNSLVDGKSETIINTNIARLRSMLPLTISIHETSMKTSGITACGELKKIN